MAIIKLDNVAATASITIQLIKDYSMYNSEIISSNGTIFQSTDSETTLTLRVYKGVEDITSKITDIEWKRFYFSGDDLKEDYSWGDNKTNKQKVSLYKDEINEKSIIQANGYSMIDGHRELVTTARITIIKISDVYISDIAPEDPGDNMMWMDINNDPPILKLWKEDLQRWITSGTDIPIVKNIIRNSNFWNNNLTEYYENRNNSYIYAPEIITNQNKNWLTLRARSNATDGGGILQKIQYPITANSNYIFSFIGYANDNEHSGAVTISIDSIGKDGKVTTILEKDNVLKTDITSISVPFKTLENTKDLQVYIGTKNKTDCYVYITELSLYNSPVYYPWELCPEDIDKQMINKLNNDRASVFKTFTDNGAIKAIYESGGQYFIKATYIVPEVVEMSAFTAFKNEDFATLQSQYIDLKTKYDALEARLKTLEDANK